LPNGCHSQPASGDYLVTKAFAFVTQSKIKDFATVALWLDRPNTNQPCSQNLYVFRNTRLLLFCVLLLIASSYARPLNQPALGCDLLRDPTYTPTN